MIENQAVQIAMNNDVPLYIELPTSVILELTYTEPGLQGDRSTGGTKPATVETGLEIQVPLFLEQGTMVKIDTRDGSYLGRVTD
jgi:elongation factor P